MSEGRAVSEPGGWGSTAPRLPRAVKPVFTLRQTEAVRVAIKSSLENEWLPPGRGRVLVNALRQLDCAQRAAR